MTSVDRTDIVVKTAAGIAEIKTRSRKLSQRLRTVLILIDGRLNVNEVQQRAAGLGLPDGFLESLARDGLIELRPGAAPAPISVVDISTADEPAPAGPADLTEEFKRVQRIQKFMNESVVNALGIRAFFFTLALDECHTRDDLVKMIPDFEKSLTKGGGAEMAKVMTQRLREMLR